MWPADREILGPPPTVDALRAIGIRDTEYTTIPTGTTWWRVHRTEGEHSVPWNGFRHFGPVLRFDPHPPPPREHQTVGLWYGAASVTAALAEAFQHSRVVDRVFRVPYLTSLRFTRPLRVLNLAADGGGHWPTRAGGNYALSYADHELTMPWANRIHEAFTALDGVRYNSRFSGHPGIALFRSAADAMPTVPVTTRALANPALAIRLATVCDQIGYQLI